MAGSQCNSSDGDLYIQSLGLTPQEMPRSASTCLVADLSNNLWILGGYKMGNSSSAGNLFRYGKHFCFYDSLLKKKKRKMYLYIRISNTLFKNFCMNLTKHESEILVLKCFSLRCILSNSWQGMKHNYSCIIYVFTLSDMI